MSVAGIIAEYNPFHSGHAWHISRTKDKADTVVCVISGAFTQRGVPGIINKWTRAKCALACGADLVLELPFPFSCAPAEIFAFGGVDLLNKLGCVDFISFGSECGTIPPLKEAADLLLKKSREISEAVKESAGEGKSYALAVADALGDYTDSRVMDSPNNLLGIKYLMALGRLNSNITPITFEREGRYNSLSLEGRFVSAAAIRKELEENGTEGIERFVPEPALKILKEEIQNGGLCDFSLADGFFSGIIRREGKGIEKYAYVAEGLENRFVDGATDYSKIPDIINYVKTKRYTHTRLSRISAAVLVGMDKEELKANTLGGAGYAKVLGANIKGTALLKKIKEAGNIDIISKGADYRKLGEYARSQFELEMKAQSVAALCYEGKNRRIANEDLLVSPHIIGG